MTQTIAILSPHLDDAVFNCCDHMLEWRRQGNDICVYTMFCSFQTRTVPDFQQEVMRKAGIATVEELEESRRQEDIRALKQLDVRWLHLDFVDAGFRSHGDAPIYENFQQLCSGKRDPHDDLLFEQMTEFVKTQIKAELILVPLCVGQHVDHQIVRQATEAAGCPGKLRYYVDYPYARNPFRWRLQQFKEAIRAKKSIRLMSSNKRKIMGCYASQMFQLFRWPPFYPEVILG